MSIIAAFLWNKSPRASISTMIFDDEKAQLLLKPKIQYLPKSYLKFRSASKTIIKEFFSQIEELSRPHKKPVIVEFKIVFEAHGIPYLSPAKESKFVYKNFSKSFKRTKKKVRAIKMKPQLRRRLSGRSLKLFKKGLQSMYLVSRKKDTNFEYHLWAVALHATPTTYAIKMQRLRNKLLAAMWDNRM